MKAFKKMMQLAELALEVLDFLQVLSSSSLAPPAFVAVTRAVLDAMKGFQDGKLSADDVRAAMDQLRENIAKNDADADAALRKRFPEDEK